MSTYQAIIPLHQDGATDTIVDQVTRENRVIAVQAAVEAGNILGESPVWDSQSGVRGLEEPKYQG